MQVSYVCRRRANAPPQAEPLENFIWHRQAVRGLIKYCLGLKSLFFLLVEEQAALRYA